MGRAAGKHGPRAPEAEYGRGDDTGINSTTGNVSNAVVIRQDVPAPEALEQFRGMMAHGVPPADVGHYNREMAEHARHPYHPDYERLPAEIIPVPVYIVERSGGGRALADSAQYHITVPAAGSEPVRLCGEDGSRSLIQLLNEDTSHNVRFGKLGNLTYDTANGVVTGGSRLPANATGYTVIRSQAPLYVVSEDSSTPRLSVILEYETADAG